MDKIHGYTILTIEVTWHERLILPSFSASAESGWDIHYSKANFDEQVTLLAPNLPTECSPA